MIQKVLDRQKTASGNEIILTDAGGDGTTVLTIGVFHGDEPSGKYLIECFLEKDLHPKNRLLFIPCLNPDGFLNKTRCNANGVDLNRNFPTKNWISGKKDKYFGGNTPASEIETMFLIQVIEKYKPDLILTLHEPYRIVNYDGPASGIAKELSKITGYKVEENIGYPTPGSFGTYCGIERNIPVITLEFAPTVESEDAVLPIETPENLGCLYDKVMEYLADSSIF